MESLTIVLEISPAMPTILMHLSIKTILLNRSTHPNMISEKVNLKLTILPVLITIIIERTNLHQLVLMSITDLLLRRGLAKMWISYLITNKFIMIINCTSSMWICIRNLIVKATITKRLITSFIIILIIKIIIIIISIQINQLIYIRLQIQGSIIIQL